MEKNKILEAARNNKSRGCEYESKESMRSSILGSIIAMLVGIVLFMVEYFVKDTVNISLIAVGMTAACVQALYEGIKSKKIYLIPPQRDSNKDYHGITCEKHEYLAKKPPILRIEPTSSQKTMNQIVKTMHQIALVFALGSCTKNA